MSRKGKRDKKRRRKGPKQGPGPRSHRKAGTPKSAARSKGAAPLMSDEPPEAQASRRASPRRRAPTGRGSEARSSRRRPPPENPLVLLLHRLTAPQPIIRLETLRILAPLCILAFMSSRLIYADYWIGDAGFQVPDLGGTWQQPLYLPPLPGATAFLFAWAMVVSGLCLSAGFLTRWAAGVFAFTLVWVALADRLAAFTVSKLGAAIAIGLFLVPCGARYGVDAYLRLRRSPGRALPTHASAGAVLFFQLTLVVMYTSSGICKARYDWLVETQVLWTHLHGSYQTPITFFLASSLPAWSWSVMQGATLTFEALAPVWFGLARTRPAAVVYGLAMHMMIGLMFGPVIWFSTLMASLLVSGFAPIWLLERTVGRLPG